MTTLYRAILVAGLLATASLADMDPQRMQRDIRIMEGVLGNYISTRLIRPPPLVVCTSTATGFSFFSKDHGPSRRIPGIGFAWDEKGVKFIELTSSDPSSG